MTAMLQFGSERQPQEVLVDTGSSWLWTYGDHCPEDSPLLSCQKTKTTFHPMESHSFEPTGKTKYIKYGKGSVEGDIVHDTVSIGDTMNQDSTTKELKADDFPFLVKYVGENFQATSIPANFGILGMAPVDDGAGPSLIQYMYDQGTIDRPYFSIVQAPSQKVDSYLTVGDYEFEADKLMKQGHHLIAHRIAGSFHW